MMGNMIGEQKVCRLRGLLYIGLALKLLVAIQRLLLLSSDAAITCMKNRLLSNLTEYSFSIRRPDTSRKYIITHRGEVPSDTP